MTDPIERMSMRVVAPLVCAAVAAVGLGAAPAAAAPVAPGPLSTATVSTTGIDTTSRTQVISTFRSRLEPLYGVRVGWTGDLATCRPGTTSSENRTATLAAVNYVRALAGLPAVSLNSAKSAKAQAAALIMAANGYLSHTPPRSAKCWTQAGYDGASHGNLYLSWGGTPPSPATGPRAVVGYMIDPGENNTRAGHRRWLMYQQLRTIGTGDTKTSNSIYVVPEEWQPPSGSRWVPWPTAGYFPRELEPDGRWSLSYPGADFSRARVSVTTPSGPLSVIKHPVATGYADNTITWDMVLPRGYASRPFSDYTVRVTVSGIRVNGSTVSRSWSTTLLSATGGVRITTSSLPDLNTNDVIQQVDLRAAGTVGSTTWRALSGLPPGYELAEYGALRRAWSGTPKVGTYTLAVMVSDAFKRAARKTFTVRVVNGPEPG